MNDDLRLLSHLAGWAALVAVLSAVLPPIDAYGIDDLRDDQVRAAPVVRLRDRVALPIASPSPPEKPPAEAASAAAGGPAPRAERREAPPTRFRAKLLGTRGQSRSALVERLWDPDERAPGIGEALEQASATGEAARGTRGRGTADEGPAGHVAIGRIGAGRVDLGRVPVTVELGTPATRDQASAASMSLKPYVGGLRYCYEKRLMVVPGLGGRVELSVGRDRSPRIVVDTTGDEELGRCVLNAARRWELPEGMDEVEVPVVFKSE